MNLHFRPDEELVKEQKTRLRKYASGIGLVAAIGLAGSIAATRDKDISTNYHNSFEGIGSLCAAVLTINAIGYGIKRKKLGEDAYTTVDVDTDKRTIIVDHNGPHTRDARMIKYAAITHVAYGEPHPTINYIDRDNGRTYKQELPFVNKDTVTGLEPYETDLKKIIEAIMTVLTKKSEPTTKTK